VSGKVVEEGRGYDLYPAGNVGCGGTGTGTVLVSKGRDRVGNESES